MAAARSSAPALCALLVACGCVSSWRERVAAARDDLDPAAVVASGAGLEGDVVWVGRCIGPVPAMPWFDELEWIDGPWHELRLDDESRPAIARLPHGTPVPAASAAPGPRFLAARSPNDDPRRPDDPRPGLDPGELYACVGTVSVRAGQAVLWFHGEALRVTTVEHPIEVRVIRDPEAATPQPGAR